MQLSVIPYDLCLYLRMTKGQIVGTVILICRISLQLPRPTVSYFVKFLDDLIERHVQQFRKVIQQSDHLTVRTLPAPGQVSAVIAVIIGWDAVQQHRMFTTKVAVNVFCDTMKSLYEAYSDTPDRLPTYWKQDGELWVSKTIDAEWKKRVIKRHKQHKREIGKLDDGNDDLVSVYKQYGTTLLGLMITDTFVYGFQLGDGDICFVDENGLDMVIEPERILGVETHSLSRENAWQKAISVVRMMNVMDRIPAIFTLSSDGYANSYKSEEEFHAAVTEYLSMLQEHGAEAVSKALAGWLKETSAMGCGDDITMLVAYFTEDSDTPSESIGEPVTEENADE